MDPFSIIEKMMELGKALKDKIKAFDTELDKLKNTLDILAPRINCVQKEEQNDLISKIEGLSLLEKEQMDGLVKKLTEAQKLLEECEGQSLLEKLIGSKTKELEEINKTLINFERKIVVDASLITLTMNMKLNSPIPKRPTLTVGLMTAVRKLEKELFGEEHSVIGIWGAGGYGKSTLARKVCEQIKGKFQRISYIQIPKSPDSPTQKKEAETLNHIRLFKKLWQGLVDIPIPKFESADSAHEMLQEELLKRSGRKLLIVLDGVWSDNMLEKFVMKMVGLKTLVTSRKKLEGLDWDYKVEELAMDDAEKLFLHHAKKDEKSKLVVETVSSESLTEIVKGCKFHPLALELIGVLLNKANGFREWETIADRLNSGHFFNEKSLEEKIYWPLKNSLDHFQETVEYECFLDLSCFPDNKRIRAAALIDMWVHTRDQKEVDAYNILKKLADRHLIELFKRRRHEYTDLDEIYNDLFVLQHDLLSEFALYISKKENPNARLAIWSAVNDDVVQQAEIVSIHNGESLNLERADVSVSFPRAKVLISNFEDCCFRLPQLLNDEMKNLKVLIISNGHKAERVPSGMPRFGYPKSLKAIRLEKMSLDILGTLSPLMGVQKLSVILCKVNRLWENGLGFDIQTVFPDLSELEIDYCDGLDILPTAVCNMVNLQRLSITNCHDLSMLPEEIGRLSKLEVLRLSACTALERLPDSLLELKKLKFLDLYGCSGIEYLPSDLGMLDSLQKIDLRSCFAKPPDTIIHFKCLTRVICNENSKTMWEGVMKTKARWMSVVGLKDFFSLNFLK